ncbi:MAG: hypothetical protein JJT94_04645 [Bernardetiaceae bacterium]|nr:hypothetical protein [Bernardetiaceae bacterium]
MKNSVQIANPIYDVVLKFLFEELSIAKLFLEAVLGYEIEELTIRPQEKPTIDNQKQKNKYKDLNTSLQRALQMSIFRLDFLAKIRTEEGTKTVMLELQKESLPNDTMRFRGYLGKLYSDKEAYETIAEHLKYPKKIGIPVIGIYILGSGLPIIKEVPILYVRNVLEDYTTKQEIKVRDYFVQSLSHESFMISVPALSKYKRTELEQLLSIFDQSNKKNSDRYILEISKEEIPEKYHKFIDRLYKAAQDPEIRKGMEELDVIYEEIVDLMHYKKHYEQERNLREQAEKRAEESLLREAKALLEAEASKQIQQKEQRKREEEQQKREEEQQKREEEQRKREEEQRKREELEIRFIKLLYAQNMPIEEIAMQLNVEVEQIIEVVNSHLK